MTVTFFGHRDTPPAVEGLLEKTLVHLIEYYSADLFLVGNQGNFDRMVRRTLKLLASEYPHVRYAVVLAYMPINQKETNCENYSDTIYPDVFDNIPKRYVISKRNQWMIEKSDTVVTYVTGVTGGAVRFKNMAAKKHKWVINLPDVLEKENTVVLGRIESGGEFCVPGATNIKYD